MTEKMTLCSKHLREHQECDMQVGPKGWEILVSCLAPQEAAWDPEEHGAAGVSDLPR